MDDSIDFDLISFPAMQQAKLSARAVPAGRVQARTLIVRTARGSIAKMQVRSGEIGADGDRPHMKIDRLIVYGVDSCIYQLASNLTLRSGAAFDLDEAREVGSGGDIRWHAPNGGGHVLEPLNGATMSALPDRVEPASLRAVGPDRKRARVEDVAGEPVYCRTRKGRLAKLVVDGSRRALRVRKLTVLDEEGEVHLQREGLAVPAGKTLDLDAGRLGDTAHYDLRHDVEAAGGGGRYMSAADRVTFVPAHQYEMFKYAPLFSAELVRAALVFEDADGALAYEQWSEARKAQLREWLHMRDTGQPFPIPGPPPLDDNLAMRPCSAWKTYLAHVVQSFWVDANRLVPWRLEDASIERLRLLLDSRTLLLFDEEGHKFARKVMGLVTAWSPFYCYDFLLENDLIGASQWGTIKRVTDWARAHLIHIPGWEHDLKGPFDSQRDQWQYYFGYPGPPPVHRMIEPLPGRKHITHGCWGTDGFLAAVLRSVNIPVRHGRTNLNDNNHSRPEFITVGRKLAHGDDPYNVQIKLGVNNVPIDRIFYTNSELEALVDAPEPMPGKTVGETGAYNHNRRVTALAVQYKTNWLLNLRCRDLHNGTSELGEALGDYYSASEIAQIAQDCDAALALIPNGCFAVDEW